MDVQSCANVRTWVGEKNLEKMAEEYQKYHIEAGDQKLSKA